MQVSHPPLFKEVADEVIAHRYLGSFSPQNLSTIEWAYATAKVSQPLLFDIVAGAAMERKHKLHTQDIASTV